MISLLSFIKHQHGGNSEGHCAVPSHEFSGKGTEMQGKEAIVPMHNYDYEAKILRIWGPEHTHSVPYTSMHIQCAIKLCWQKFNVNTALQKWSLS